MDKGKQSISDHCFNKTVGICGDSPPKNYFILADVSKTLEPIISLLAQDFPGSGWLEKSRIPKAPILESHGNTIKQSQIYLAVSKIWRLWMSTHQKTYGLILWNLWIALCPKPPNMDQLAEMVRKFEEELNGLSALAAEDEATKIQVYADCVEIATEDERQRRRAFIQKVEKLMTPSRQKRKTTEFDEDVVVESLKIAGRKVIAEGKHVNHTIDRAFKYNEMDLVNVLLCNHREPVLDDLQQLLQMLLTSSARKAELMEFKDQAADVLKELEALRTIANTNVTTSNMPEVYELIGRHMDEAVNIDDIDDVRLWLGRKTWLGSLAEEIGSIHFEQVGREGQHPWDTIPLEMSPRNVPRAWFVMSRGLVCWDALFQVHGWTAGALPALRRVNAGCMWEGGSGWCAETCLVSPGRCAKHEASRILIQVFIDPTSKAWNRSPMPIPHWKRLVSRSRWVQSACGASWWGDQLNISGCQFQNEYQQHVGENARSIFSDSPRSFSRAVRLMLETTAAWQTNWGSSSET